MEPHRVRKRRDWSRTFGLRVYATGRWMRRHQTAIFCAVLIPFFTALAVLGTAYWHYSHVIDLRLAGGPFAGAVNVYGATLVLNDGDALTPDEIASDLKATGAKVSVDGSRISVSPPDAAGFDIVAGPKQIERIERNGKDVKTVTAGSPLFANLTARREKRELVTFDRIPRSLVSAVSAAEDKHFFTHDGIDVPRIVKAAYVDIRTRRKEQGASTLTMQLVRDLYLDSDKRWKRKLAEAMMTVHLEREWPKNKIFETYANEVYLGREQSYSIHGFAEGAESFFGKKLADISLPEAATLAGMVQRPSYFNPRRNPEATEHRRNLVLSLMRDNRYIDEAEYRDAASAPLNVSGPAVRDDPYGASYFLDLVTDELENHEAHETSGDGIRTSIDIDLQRAANEAVREGMAEVDKQLAAKYAKSGVRAEAALIALDPHTGEIKAVVGGRDYSKSQLNRILAKRPPGSVFKPFVYAAALDTAVDGGSQTFTPASLVNDAPATFGSGRYAYTPANFKNESYGTLTFRDALAKSDNIAAVKVAQMVGYQNVVNVARRAGLNDDIQPTPSVALGTYAVTPLEIAGAYTVFANGGLWIRPRITEDSTSDAHQALDPRVAYLMVNMMEEVMRSGTAAGVRSRGFNLPAAGKTGTSHDGWFAGFTSNLLCVVWVGFDNYQELDLEGAKSALPVWTSFMKKAAQLGRYRNAREFPQVAGVDAARICLRSGKLAGPLCANTRNEVFIEGTEPTETCDVDVETLPVVQTSAPILTPPVGQTADPSNP